MAYSVVWIYKTKINPDKNFILDDIYEYLASLTGSVKLDNFQFIKHAMNITIKVNKNQFNMSPLNAESDGIGLYNYVSISEVNANEPSRSASHNKIVYYFITGKRWLGQETIELSLTMDTLNTFACNFTSSSLDPKSKWTRYTAKAYAKGVSQTRFLIPFRCDDIHPIKYKTYSEKLLDSKETSTINWYLIYRNQEVESDSVEKPIRCYLTCDKDNLKVRTQYNYSIADHSAMSKKYYYILSSVNPHGNIRFMYGNRLVSMTLKGDDSIIIEQLPNGYRIIYAQLAWGSYMGYYDYSDVSDQEITLTGIEKIYASDTYYGSYATIITQTEIDPSDSPANLDLNPISSIDRTDSRYVKIILLPYCPITMTLYSVNTYSLGSNFSYDLGLGLIEILQPTKLLSRTIELNSQSLKNPTLMMRVDNSYFSLVSNTDLVANVWGNYHYEPMLLHSNYYNVKYVYDTFEKDFELEKIQWNEDPTNMNITYVNFTMTSTINSRFYFDFKDTDHYTFKTFSDIYPSLLFIQRNNELTLYSNAFIQYLRTGYNYDVKNKDINLAKTIVGTALGTMGSVISGAGSKGGLGALGAVSIAVSTANRLVDGIFSQIQMENNMEQKKTQYMYETTGVSGADDVDLMLAYSGNKLYRYDYEVSEPIKNMLHQLYFYTGYPCEEMSSTIPNNNRYWFDFVQGEIIFAYPTDENYTDEIQIDIKSKYLEGVTYLHEHNGAYDFEQKYINLDNDLIPDE